jgi:hypothetical protein
MATDLQAFSRWLQDSALAEHSLAPSQHAVLQAAFHFLQQRGRDYYSCRLLSHFLLHAGTGLKVAQIARLLGISRSAASAQQGLSSKEVIQATHHRLAGRSHGKLLPRFAGPIAQFLCENPQATRYDLLDFIQRTWGVSASRMGLYKYLKKYGLDEASRIVPVPAPPPATAAQAAAPATPTGPTPAVIMASAAAPPQPGVPVPLPPADFFLPPPTTLAPSCCCPPL